MRPEERGHATHLGMLARVPQRGAQKSSTSGVGTDFACGHEGPMAVRTRDTASGIVIVLSEEVGEIATDADGMAVV